MQQALWYLASPYSKFEKGHEEAFKEAAKAAATLLKRGLRVFSPIAHSHPIAVYGDIDKVDHDFWLRLDIAILDECDGLLVVMMPGWKESLGVQAEISHAEKTGKPVSYLSWPMLSEREHESA
jgi:nucleoside 2-deoxyribosyltransferase